MSNKDYFKQNQKMLLSFLNTEGGRYLLGIKDSYPIVKVTENSFHQLRDFKNDNAIIQARFYVGDAIANTLLPIFTKMQIADQEYKKILDGREAFLHFSGLEEKRRIYPQIYLTTGTFNAGAGDGEVNSNTFDTWAAARAAATGSEVINQPTTNDQGRWAGAYNYSSAPVVYLCGRTFYPVDTSGLTASAIITEVLLKVSSNTRADMLGVLGIIVPSTQASTSTLVAADYDNITYTAWSDAVTVGAAASTTYTLTFTAAGIAGINLTGFTKFAAISKTYDFDNASPGTGNRWGSIYNSGTGSGATIPNLSITYTVPSAATTFTQFLNSGFIEF